MLSNKYIKNKTIKIWGATGVLQHESGLGDRGGPARGVDVRPSSPGSGVWAPDHGVHTLSKQRRRAGLHRTHLLKLGSDAEAGFSSISIAWKREKTEVR
jgi:hypothetical protein